MNNDGWGFLGAGTSDNRLAGRDLQHNRQTRTADEAPREHRIVRQAAEDGGPMKAYMENMEHRRAAHPRQEKRRHEGSMKQHLDQEKLRHQQGRETSLKHLEDHYKR